MITCFASPMRLLERCRSFPLLETAQHKFGRGNILDREDFGRSLPSSSMRVVSTIAIIHSV